VEEGVGRGVVAGGWDVGSGGTRRRVCGAEAGKEVGSVYFIERFYKSGWLGKGEE